MPDDANQTTDPTDRDRELAAYWTERGDLRAWLAGIIAAARRAEREEERDRCARVAEHMADWSEVADSSTGYAIAKRIRSGANP